MGVSPLWGQKTKITRISLPERIHRFGVLTGAKLLPDSKVPEFLCVLKNPTTKQVFLLCVDSFGKIIFRQDMGWAGNTTAVAASAFDLDKDGIDEIVYIERRGRSFYLIVRKGGRRHTFTALYRGTGRTLKHWHLTFCRVDRQWGVVVQYGTYSNERKEIIVFKLVSNELRLVWERKFPPGEHWAHRIYPVQTDNDPDHEFLAGFRHFDNNGETKVWLKSYWKGRGIPHVDEVRQRRGLFYFGVESPPGGVFITRQDKIVTRFGKFCPNAGNHIHVMYVENLWGDLLPEISVGIKKVPGGMVCWKIFSSARQVPWQIFPGPINWTGHLQRKEFIKNGVIVRLDKNGKPEYKMLMRPPG
jgi:hypothetical protein